MKNLKLRDLTFTALAAAFICVLAPISIPLPFTSVPITLATFIIYICGISLGARTALTGTVIYIILGIIGLPVFSQFSSGIGRIMGATGGYIIGYVFLAFFSGLFSDISRKIKKHIIVLNVLGIITGTAVCYLLGTVWFCCVTSNPPLSALALCVLPFIPLDIVKMILSIALGLKIRKIYDALNEADNIQKSNNF